MGKIKRFLKRMSLKVRVGYNKIRKGVLRLIAKEMLFATEHPRFVGNVEGFLISLAASLIVAWIFK